MFISLTMLASSSTQQIYTVVLEIRNSMPVADTRWTYFQAPLLVEDVLGYKFPVPSEYDYSMLNTIIKHKFRTGPGSAQVKTGRYGLLQEREYKLVTAATRLLPGVEITMYVTLDELPVNKVCPMPRCGSTEAFYYPGGGFVW